MGISVIIPVYNTEKYLEDCLNSVVNQSLPFEQIIIVNDGSTDNSLEICNAYAEKFSNVQIFSQKNQGLSAARNSGLKLVTSDYVMFLDSDDYLRNDSVEKILSQMTSFDLDILYFDSEIKNELKNERKQNVYDRVNKISYERMSGKEYFLKCYPDYFIVSACMICIRMQFLKEKGLKFPNVRKHEDIFFSFKAMLEAKYVQYVPHKLYLRRYRENSIMTTAFSTDAWMDRCRAYFWCWEYIQDTMSRYTEDEAEVMKVFFLMSFQELRGIYKRISLERNEEFYQELQKRFCTFWNRDWIVGKQKLSLMASKAIVHLLKELSEEEQIMIDHMGDSIDVIEKLSQKQYLEELKKVLGKVPLNEKGKKVGIYGTGKHTDQLLTWYKFFYENILCDLYFIDTYKKSNENCYYDRPIINIADAMDYVDSIVISSSEYESEMAEKVKELYGESIPITRFYDKYKGFIFLTYEEIFENSRNKSKE